MKEHYHHGDLKRQLLETAIQTISQKGFDGLSLRGVAAACGVSHNAAYRHFESKEQLIALCRAHAAACLTRALEPAEGDLPALCRAYIRFYLDHPTYYSPLLRNAPVCLAFTLEDRPENYPPFAAFRRAFLAWAEETSILTEDRPVLMARLWAELSGLLTMLLSPNVEWAGAWEDCLDAFFRETVRCADQC